MASMLGSSPPPTCGSFVTLLGVVGIAVHGHQFPALSQRAHRLRQGRQQADDALGRLRKADLNTPVVGDLEGMGCTEGHQDGKCQGAKNMRHGKAAVSIRHRTQT